MNPLVSFKATTENLVANSRLARNFLVIFTYLILALAFTWPLLQNFSKAIPASFPDHYQTIWNFWWVRHSLLEQHINPYITDVLFYPYRAQGDPLPLYMHTLQPLLSIFGGIFSIIFNYPVAYNLLILFGYVFSGWATYLLTIHFTGLYFPSFIAGLLYTFSSYHISIMMNGQMHQFSAYFTPLYLLCLHLALEKTLPKRGNLKYAFLASLFLIIIFYTSQYFFVQAALYSAALFLYLALKGIRQKRLRQLIVTGGVIAVTTLLFILPFAWKMISTTHDGAIIFEDSTLKQETVWQSSALLSFFVPAREGWGIWSPAFLGYSLLILAIIGTVIVFRSKKGGLWWVGVSFVALLFSMGPRFKLTTADSGNAASLLSSGFPMPYQLYQQLPFLNYSRDPSTFLALATLGLSVLAAIAFSWFLPRIRYIVAILVIAVLFIESPALPVKLDALYYPKILDTFATDPDKSFAIAEFPITANYYRDSRRMFFQTIHQHPITGGYISRRVIQYYDESDGLGRFYSQSSDPALGEKQDLAEILQLYCQVYNFKYVLNYRDEYGSLAEANKFDQLLKDSLGANAKISDDGTTSAFRVTSEVVGQTPLLVGTKGGYAGEKLADGRGYRWVADTLSLQILANEDSEIQLSFMSWSLPPQNSLDIQINGRDLGNFELAATPTESTLKLKLSKGANLIIFKGLQPARTPQELNLPYKDDRKLGFALGNIKLVK